MSLSEFGILVLLVLRRYTNPQSLGRGSGCCMDPLKGFCARDSAARQPGFFVVANTYGGRWSCPRFAAVEVRLKFSDGPSRLEDNARERRQD